MIDKRTKIVSRPKLSVFILCFLLISSFKAFLVQSLSQSSSSSPQVGVGESSSSSSPECINTIDTISKQQDSIASEKQETDSTTTTTATDTMTTATGEQRVNSKDGTEIYVKSYNVASPKAQLLVVHGYLEHCLRYDEFAQAMAAHGISTTLFDYRGHGRSGGDRAYLDNWDSYLQDLLAAKATLGDDVPTFLLGHSNGGLIAMDYMLNSENHNVKGLVVSSPFLAPADDLGWVAKTIAKLLGGWFPGLKLPANLKSENLTSDPVKQKEHSEDELCLPDATAGWASRCMQAQERLQTAILKSCDGATVPVPLLFAYGSEDKVAKASLNEEVAEKLKSEDKTVVRREGEGHEILNEVKRKELFDIVAEWILKKA